MKRSILFWGFQNMEDVVEVSQKIRSESNGLIDLYVQVAPGEKTVQLLEINPEEILRTHFIDLGFLVLWIKQNFEKNIFVVFNFWQLFLSAELFLEIEDFKKLLQQKAVFLFFGPRLCLKQNEYFFPEKIGKFNDKNLRVYETFLNASADISVFQTPVCLDFLNAFCQRYFFKPKKFLFFYTIPKIFRDFYLIFVSRKKLLDFLSYEITLRINEKADDHALKNKADFFVFLKALSHPDIENPFRGKEKKIKGFFKKKRSFYVSLEKFFNKNNKKEISFLYWLIYLGIEEYEISFLNKKEKSVFFLKEGKEKIS